MANNENLKNGAPYRFRAGEEQVELAKKAGRASGEARRRKKSMRDAAKVLLEMPVAQKQGKMRGAMQALDISEDDMDYNMSILAAMLIKASNGNVGAAQFLRDTAGENPFLALQEKQFDFEVEQKTGQGADIEDISGAVMDIWGYEAWEGVLADGIPVNLTQAIEYRFGERIVEYMRRTPDCMYNIAEGAVRAGKTVGNILSFAVDLCRTPDKIHIASGSTLANAKMNIGDANGFGLEHIFRGQCRWGKYKGNEALIIRGPYTHFQERIVIFAGGMLSSSFQKIRGNSYGLWIATEINLHHDTFIKEVFNRSIAAKMRKVYWDLNPDHPKHRIYVEYIDKYAKRAEQGKLLGGFNYIHMTLFDNVTVTEERREEIISQYEPGSVWYIRDIEGKRSIAEGLIYRKFAGAVQGTKNPYKITLAAAKGMMDRGELLGVTIGVDFGGNGSGHAFVASAPSLGYEKLVILSARRYTQEVTPDELEALLVDFVDRVYSTFGRVNMAYFDHEPVLIRGCQKALAVAGLGNVPTNYAMKDRINDRIFAAVALQAQGRFIYTDDCESLEEALKTAVWDPKKVELTRLDDGTSDIDSLDAMEYSYEHDIRHYIDSSYLPSSKTGGEDEQ